LVLLLLAAAPLGVSLIWFGPRIWTRQWCEIPAALGWSAIRYPWTDDFREREAAPARSLALDKLFLNPTADDPAERARRLHGLSLVIRERWEPFAHDPIKLTWAGELSDIGRQLLADSLQPQQFSAQLRSALSDLPHDAPLQAELIFGTRGQPMWLTAGATDSVERTGTVLIQSDAAPPTLQLPAGAVWQAIVDASRSLREHAPAGFPDVFAHWLPLAQSPGNTANIWTRLVDTDIAWLERSAEDAYAKAIEKLSRAPVDQYLEKALEDRAQLAWESLGLDPRMAQRVARHGRSMSAQAVGRQCAQHIELIEAVAKRAFQENDLERAARWVGLMEGATRVLEKSVRSPWIINYVQHKRNGAGAMAQLIQSEPGCTPELAAEMAALIARCPAASPRAVVLSDAKVRVFYFESIARSSLRIAVVTLLAALIGAIHLRTPRNETGGIVLMRSSPAGSECIAFAAVIVVFGAFIVLEATNGLGEGVASSLYAFVSLAVLVGLIGRLGWLIIAEFVRDSDSSRQSLRRRVFWLIGCMVLLAALRPLIGRAEGATAALGWLHPRDASTLEGGLSGPVRLLLGAAFAAFAIAYALLRWRRMRRAHQVPMTIHPLVFSGIALWLGIWIAYGPPGAWLRREAVFASFSGQWSAVMEAVDYVSAVFFEGPITNDPALCRGWNLLTLSVAARMIHFGWWLVLACYVISVIAIPPKWPLRALLSNSPTHSEQDVANARLSMVAWSCLWIGLFAVAIHAWCTLGMGYSIDQAIAQGS
jgi:hypothetical protein